mgnify:CR=1 FL=1
MNARRFGGLYRMTERLSEGRQRFEVSPPHLSHREEDNGVTEF